MKKINSSVYKKAVIGLLWLLILSSKRERHSKSNEVDSMAPAAVKHTKYELKKIVQDWYTAIEV